MAFLLEENRVRVIELLYISIIPYNECQLHPVIPYSEVTTEIGNLLTMRCRVTVFVGVFYAQSRGE